MAAPDLFSDLSLARRLERAEAEASAKFVEARARVSPGSGATWFEVAGAYAMYDGPASPITQTFGLGLFEAAGKNELTELERFFAERGAPVCHEVSPLAGVPVMTLLHERGYEPVEFTSVMYRPVGGGTARSVSHNQNQNIRVRPIREGEEAIWAQTSAKGWGEFPELTEFILEFAPMSTQRENSVSFLAELNGEPIATGALCISGGVALLAGACTIPERRKQGAQLALLENRLRYAAEHGCDIAMMCAAPGSASQRNAERHGFRIAYTRIKWKL